MARFLALGDSYTIGEGVTEGDRWPDQLVQLLRKKGGVIDDPVIIARTGWTTDELWAAIEAANPGARYDLVTLLVGVNDQYRGRSLEGFEREFQRLAARAITLAGERPPRAIVISIPDWSVTPFAEQDSRGRAAIAREIGEFNACARSIASALGAQWLDVTAESRRAAEDPELLAPDGLHPSARMYSRWAEILVPVARAALSA